MGSWLKMPLDWPCHFILEPPRPPCDFINLKFRFTTLWQFENQSVGRHDGYLQMLTYLYFLCCRLCSDVSALGPWLWLYPNLFGKISSWHIWVLDADVGLPLFVHFLSFVQFLVYFLSIYCPSYVLILSLSHFWLLFVQQIPTFVHFQCIFCPPCLIFVLFLPKFLAGIWAKNDWTKARQNLDKMFSLIYNLVNLWLDKI